MMTPDMNILRGFVFLFLTMLVTGGIPSARADGLRPAPVLGVSADGEACLLGGRHVGKLVGPEVVAPDMKHGELYQLHNLGRRTGIAPTIGAPKEQSTEGGDCSGLWMQELALDPLRDKQPSLAIRSLNGKKSLDPFPVKKLDTRDQKHRQIVVSFLKSRQMTAPFIRITQALGADFTGDGHQDILINAVRAARNKERKGDYSILILQPGAPAKSEPIVIQEELITKDRRFPGNLWINVVVEVIDIDGDKRPEIIMEGQSLYGGGWEVIRIRDGKAEHVLFCGCEG